MATTSSLMITTIVILLLCYCVRLVELQGCLKCAPRTRHTDRCCRRFAMCCPAESQGAEQTVTISSSDRDNISSSSSSKIGKCPDDRFPNATVTICLRKSCTEDVHCFGPQKCCSFGNTKCCVYPLSPLFT